MKIALCHLTGSLRGRTQYFDTASVSFGVEDQCHVMFDREKDPEVCPVHARLSVEDHAPVIRDCSGKSALLINGQRSFESELKDGDLLQFGEGGPLVRFRLTPEDSPETKPWRDIVADCRDIVVRTPHPRYLSPLYLVRRLLADIARYGSAAAKIAAAGAVLAPVLLITLLGIVVYRQHVAADATERRMAELVSQLEAGRLTREEMGRRSEQERNFAGNTRSWSPRSPPHSKSRRPPAGPGRKSRRSTDSCARSKAGSGLPKRSWPNLRAGSGCCKEGMDFWKKAPDGPCGTRDSIHWAIPIWTETAIRW
jgi:hypothetical protein